jgi:hypothetical protein
MFLTFSVSTGRSTDIESVIALSAWRKKKENIPSSSDILIIEINLATSIFYWVLDTDSSAHICLKCAGTKE